MLRRILGYAVLAVVFLFALKIALGLFGMLLGIAITVAVLGAMGYGCYLILKVVSPELALKVRELIKGPGSGSAPMSHPPV